MKLCSRCGKIKELIEFSKQKEGKNGLTSACRICHKETNGKYYLKNKKQIREGNRKWGIENKELMREFYRKWRNNNFDKAKDHHRKWALKNKDKVIKSVRDWRAKNPDKMREMRKRADIKKTSTLKGKLNNCLSSSIRHSLKKGIKAGRHWENLVGFTIGQLKVHLEKLFKPGMSWQNYGNFWEIDHRIPVAVFNFERPEDIDFRLCWNLKNLQPLCVRENRSKNAKLNKPFQPSLKIGLK